MVPSLASVASVVCCVPGRRTTSVHNDFRIPITVPLVASSLIKDITIEYHPTTGKTVSDRYIALIHSWNRVRPKPRTDGELTRSQLRGKNKLACSQVTESALI